jgi:hypothetical protein
VFPTYTDSSNKTSRIYPQRNIVDGFGNVFETGSFAGEVTFGNFRLTANGNNDIFVVKYNKANGEVSWAKSAGIIVPNWYSDSGNGIVVDIIGDVYVVGDFEGTVKFGDQVIKPYGTMDMFLAKYDGATGAVKWVTHAGGLLT